MQDKDVEAEAEAREIVKITDKSLGSERQASAAAYLAPSWISRENTKRQKFKSDRRCVEDEKANNADPDTLDSSRHSGEKSLVPGKKCSEAETLLRELIRANEKVLQAVVYLLETM